jgi:uncharacterized membrane protein YjgN (DUF898 family)
VRRKKYFYQNTLIDHVGFDYHAKPLSILKGRAIALVAYLAFLFSGTLHPLMPMVLAVLLFVFIPWIIVRGLTFNARNSSHRGLRFNFDGSLGGAAKVLLALPILLIFTLGLIMPFNAQRQTRYMVDGHLFGNSRFNIGATVKQFYKIYWVILIPFIVIGILAVTALPAYQSYVKKAHETEMQAPLPPAFVALPQGVKQPIQLAANEVNDTIKLQNGATVATIVVNQPNINDMFNGVGLQNPNDIPDYNALILQLQTPATVPAPVEEFEETPAEELLGADGKPLSDEEAYQQMMENMTPEQKAEMAKFGQEIEAQIYAEAGAEAPPKPEDIFKKMFGAFSVAGMIGVVAGYFLFIFGGLAYFQSRLHNLMWNTTTLDKVSFNSTLRMRDLMWLYFSNIVVIALSFGLMTPWAQIRMARYRAEKLTVLGVDNIDAFVGDKKAEMKATGEELADFFDVDLSFM